MKKVRAAVELLTELHICHCEPERRSNLLA